MNKSGKIIKLNNELNYGFIKVAKLGDVFFSEDTESEINTFSDYRLEQRVKLEVIETSRGLFAKSLTLKS